MAIATKLMPRALVMTALCAVVAAFIGTPQAVAQSPSKTAITVGIPAFYEGFLPLYTAEKKQFFEDEGLAVNILTFQGGGAAGQAFVAGGIEMCLCSFDHVLKLQSRGFDAVAIGGIEEFNAYALISKKGRIADGLKGLRGKKIGITSPGSSTDITVRYELKKAGIDIRDVSLVSIGNAAAMKAALEQGELDAGMVIGGILVDMLNNPNWQIIVDFRTQRYPLEVVIARRSWLKDHAPTARKFLKAIVRAEELLQKDPAVAYEMTQAMFPKMDPKTLKGVGEAGVRRLSTNGSIDEQGVAAITDQQIFAGAIKSSIPYKSLVDLSYLPSGTAR